MFSGNNVADQPEFYLFIAATILLSLGYMWGRRRNRRITYSAFDAISGILKPKDQTFTTIGGLTGYHANFIPHKNRSIKQVDATMTLLPRQSWLWYPFSLFLRRFDRLFLSFHLGKKATGSLREGHLIEKKYSTFAGARIENADSLHKETITWGKRTFFLYYKDDAVKREMERCQQMVGTDPGPLRHVALVPSQNRLFVFLIPVLGTVEHVVGQVYRWFLKIADSTQE
ncbi:MAG: hypothetical protein PF508_01210 [Spirochaeta sp.]|nr:hypothetical protein [Spirochaeta sp.]